MALVNLMFEQRKWLLKCYWKTENVTEVQRSWRSKFGKPPPPPVKVGNIRDKFQVSGPVQIVNKDRSGKPRS
jgi:hypothetical protein